MERADEQGEPEVEKGPSRHRAAAGKRWSRVMRRWLPESWLHARLDPGRVGLLGLSLAGVIGLLVVVIAVWADQPSAESAPPLRPPVLVAPSSTSAVPEHIVVSVVGKVSRPGLVSVAAGSRVADALDAVGGPLPDTDVSALNLARKLIDGEQLYVAVPIPPGVAVPADPVANGTEPGAPGARVDLNTATEEQLDELPGVGEVTADRIIRWRTEHGRFTSVEQLREIGGIGESRFERLRDLVRV